MGRDFQAELPPCFGDVEGSREEESPGEQLLWKPWDKLEESTNSQDKGKWLSNPKLFEKTNFGVLIAPKMPVNLNHYNQILGSNLLG